MGNKDIFDMLAGSYDTTERVNIANLSADAIRSYLFDSHDKTAIDFGCGTGLVGISLSSEFKSLILIDSSERMVDIVNSKLKEINIQNAYALCIDLETGDILDIKADYIFMAQVLLHIKDYVEVLRMLRKMLNKDGHLIIVDFDKNDEVVSDLVHNGFDQKELKTLMNKIGYKNIRSEIFHRGKGIFMGNDAAQFILDAQIENYKE